MTNFRGVNTTSRVSSGVFFLLFFSFPLSPANILLLAGCRLHSLNLTFEKPYLIVHGESKLGKASLLMLLRNIHWTSSRFLQSEIDLAFLNGSTTYPPNLIPECILTRWGTTTKAINWLDENWDDYKTLCRLKFDSLKAGSVQKIYGNSGAWMGMQAMRADFLFFSCWCNNVYEKFYSYLLSGKDTKSQAPGFRAHRIARHYAEYEMLLKRMMNGGWKTAPEFKRFADYWRDMEVPEQKEVRREKRKQCVSSRFLQSSF